MLDKTMLKHLKSILGLPINTSHRRLHVCLGECNIQIHLVLRLLKNYHKYLQHFGEEAYLLKQIQAKYFSDDEINGINFDYGKLKRRLVDNNISEKAKEFLDCEVRPGHRNFLKKFFFTHRDLRDF
jgi:hypothetical protein